MATMLDAPSGARTRSDFDDWLGASAPGERFVYAWGEAPQRRAPIWSYAAEISGDGLVRLHHARRSDGGWDFIAVRTDPPIGAAGGAVRVIGDHDNPAEQMMKRLRRAANFRQRCPSNADLAVECGLRDAAAASYCLRKLRDAGLIRILEQGRGLPRIVTIVATGKATAQGNA